MNNRDPFNLRQTAPASSLFQSSSASIAHRARQVPRATAGLTANTTADTASANDPGGSSASSTMAYSSQSGPTHRHPDVWHSSGQSRFQNNSHPDRTVGEKISGMLGTERKPSLPMYKDKPYQYPTGRRKAPWFKQRRVIALALIFLAGISWWFGILSPLSFATQKGNGQKSKDSWSFSGSRNVDWAARAEKVKEAFRLSFTDYEKHAWGDDEYHPVAKTGKKMVPNGMGWIIIDALDTMMLMNLTTELQHARQWIHDTLTYDQDHDVSTFETTIRMMGGLLSAHYLSTSFPGVYAPVSDEYGADLYIEKATDLADRLLGAFETRSGVPLASVNLHTMQGIPSHADGGASSTAEATSVQLEMKYLAKLTGETHYWEKAEQVMKVVDDNNMPDGLLPIFIYADQGNFRGNNIRLGSRGDSYYEYLIKQYLQTEQQESVYQAMWNESLAGIKKHLLTYSYPNNFTVLAERPNGLDNIIEPKMDHLVCFMPGTIALATTGGMRLSDAMESIVWSKEQDEDIKLAKELMKTCWGMYTVTPTGLAGEITYFHLHTPTLMYEEFTSDNRPSGPADVVPDNAEDGEAKAAALWEDYIIKSSDQHNLQRPETVESLFYMWRITGDEMYREWGWRMFESFIKHTVTPDGLSYSSINSVMRVPPHLRDNMESFWLAETLKYFYLLFSSPDILPLTDVVFNTEAHPFPRFQMGKLFKTGWERKPRDKEGRIVQSTESSIQDEAGIATEIAAGGVQTQTVHVEETTTTADEVAPTTAQNVAVSTPSTELAAEQTLTPVSEVAAAVVGDGSVAGQAGMFVT